MKNQRVPLILAALGGSALAWLTHEPPSRSADAAKDVAQDAAQEQRVGEPTATRPATNRAPQRVVIAASKPIATRDATSPSYDSVLRAQLLDESPSEVFETEPRMEEWAEDFEVRLAAHLTTLADGLYPDLEIEAECRSASCSVTIRAGDALDELEAFFGNYAPIGEVVDTSWTTDDSGRSLVLTGLLPPRLRDFRAFEEWSEEYRRLRQERISRMRAQ